MVDGVVSLTKHRQAMHLLRLEVLAEIDRLENERCDNCRGPMGLNAKVDRYRCGCPAAVRIRKIGDKLNGVKR